MAANILKIIGQRIRDVRKERGLSQEQLAEIAEVHYSYIGALERGEKNITVINLQRIADALNVDVFEFFTNGLINIKGSAKQREIQEVVDLLLELKQKEILKIKAVIKELIK